MNVLLPEESIKNIQDKIEDLRKPYKNIISAPYSQSAGEEKMFGIFVRLFNDNIKSKTIDLNNILEEVMNLGMKTRQEQLNGFSMESGKDILEKYKKEKGL